MTTETAKPGETQEKVAPIEVHNPEGEAADNAQLRTTPPQGDAPKPKEPDVPVVLKHDPRAAIADKFKKSREDKDPGIEATGDYNDPTQTYGRHGEAPKEEPKEESKEPPKAELPAPEPLPTKIKVKIRGEEREVTQEELIAAAQKGLAGDDYVREARKLLEDTEQQVRSSRQHPDATKPAPATEPTASDDGSTPADPMKNLVEKIQYGDPDEAAKLLSDTLQGMTEKAVTRTTLNNRVQADVENDKAAGAKFIEANPDLAKDPIATAAVRDRLANGYREDLKKIGVPEDKIPSDVEALASHHRFYKLQGQPVRSVPALLENAKQEYLTWRGPREQTPTPSPEPRVEVRVDRTDRKMNVPQQPTRATVPPQLTQSQAPVQTNRSAAVQRARQARGQTVA